MPDPTKKEIVEKIRSLVNDANWIGMSKKEIEAIFTTVLIEKEIR